MGMRGKVIMLGMLVAFFVSGCSVRLVDFTVISTKNAYIAAKSKGSRVKGEDCVFSCLGLPFGIPNMKEAIDRTIQNAGSEYDALIDGVLYQTTNPFQICYKVEGTPVNTKVRGAMNEKDKENLLVHSKRLTGN